MSSRRAFCLSLLLTLLLALFWCALITADLHTRAVALEDPRPPYAAVSDVPFLPLPAQGEILRWLWRAEYRVAEWMVSLC